MISTHTPNSRSGSWFKKLALLASGLVVATLASAGSVTISGTVNASCASWSSVSGDGTNITYVCGTSQSSTGGNFALSAPASLDVNQTYASGASGISVSRNGGTDPFSITVAGNAGCTPDVNTLAWGASENTSKDIGVATLTGTCTIAITVPAGGTGTSSKNIALANPGADVTFAFDLASIPGTSFGAPTTVIKVKRSGGSLGDWSVPYLANGFMGNNTAGTTTPAPNGGTLNFPAGSSEANITFTPVSSQPAGFTLPASASVQLQTPVKSGTAGSAIGTIAGNDTRTFSINAVTGCPAVTNMTTFTFQGSGAQTFNNLAPGKIGVYAMPVPLPTAGKASITKIAGAQSGTDIEMWYSTCPGNVADPLRNQVNYIGSKACMASYQWAGGNLFWHKFDPSEGACQLPDSGGPYYFNYRHVKLSNPSVNSCLLQSCPTVGTYTSLVP